MVEIASERLAAKERERGVLGYVERARPTTRVVQPQYRPSQESIMARARVMIVLSSIGMAWPTPFKISSRAPAIRLAII